MPKNQRDALGVILTLGITAFIAALLLGAATNCSWWHHSFCEDAGASGSILTITFAMGTVGVIMFFVGGIGREIRREGKLTPGVDNEIRRQHEMGSITRKPLLPNAMILIGLILVFGVSTTLVGAQWNWVSFIVGVGISLTGYLLKRRHIDQRRNRAYGLDSQA